MCGIVGMFGNLTVDHEKAFKDLLAIDVIRGPHSTGVFSVTSTKDVSHFKKAMIPHDFMAMQPFQDILKKQNRVLVGHNRWATKGAVNNINAHPFEVGDIVGVHNGTLTGQWRLPDYKQFAVDSENIIHSLNKVGVKDTVEDLEGAYAMVWYDQKGDSLNIIRNNERTLYYTELVKHGVVVFASEDWMIEGVLGRHGIAHGEVEMFPEDSHFRFDLPKTAKDKWTKPHITQIKGVPPVKKGWAGHRVGSGKTAVGNQSTTQVGSYKINSVMTVNQGDRVRFFVDKFEETMKNSHRYRITGCLTRKWSQEVVMYLEDKHPLYDLLDSYQTDFSGCISSMFMSGSSNNILNIIINPGTLEVVDDGDEGFEESEDLKYTGSSGNLVSEKKWIESTKMGCGYCGDIPVPALADQLNWVTHDAFVCPTCQEHNHQKEIALTTH